MEAQRLHFRANSIPNLEFVRELGMSQSRVSELLTTRAELLMRKPESFSELASQVQQFGFDPQKSDFVQAMRH